MSASKTAKAHGHKSLEEVARMICSNADTMQKWYKNKPALFNAIIIGCAEIKRRNHEDLQKKKKLS